MTKFGQTTDYSASKHIRDLEKYLGKGVLDYVCINTQKPDSEALKWYQNQQEIPVLNDKQNVPV